MEHLAQGIHLGSDIPGANGHPQFVPVVLSVEQDELGLPGFPFIQHPEVSAHDPAGHVQ